MSGTSIPCLCHPCLCQAMSREQWRAPIASRNLTPSWPNSSARSSDHDRTQPSSAQIPPDSQMQPDPAFSEVRPGTAQVRSDPIRPKPAPGSRPANAGPPSSGFGTTDEPSVASTTWSTRLRPQLPATSLHDRRRQERREFMPIGLRKRERRRPGRPLFGT